jgi:hypothetical protein
MGGPWLARGGAALRRGALPSCHCNLLQYRHSSKLRSHRPHERRWIDIAEIEGELVTLTLAYTRRGTTIRFISFRPASCKERSDYMSHRGDVEACRQKIGIHFSYYRDQSDTHQMRS